MTGPYKNEREAVTAARSVIPPEPSRSILSVTQRHELLRRAFAAAGVELSGFEDGTAWWLCRGEEHTVALIARWVTAAHEAGKAAGPAAEAVALLEEALFLRANGERPPGSPDATWHQWDYAAERYLRSLLPPERCHGRMNNPAAEPREDEARA